MDHIERVKRTIEFQSPDILPFELLDVPGIYDAYATLDPDQVKSIPFTSDCDSVRTTYHWTFKPEGKNADGEQMRRDEWGCLHRVPADMNLAYDIVEKPLKDPKSFAYYKFPDPSVSDPFFEEIERRLESYRDRFICAYIDPGPFLIAFNLMGYEQLLLRLKDDLSQVIEVIAGIVEFQKGIIDRWKRLGVHMIASIDEFAGTTGMMFSPDLWRDHFKKYFIDLFQHAKNQGMYTSLYLDGDISSIFKDLDDLALDMLESLQPNVTGIHRWSEQFSGRICLKASADMMTTLPNGDESRIRNELKNVFQACASPKGGFVPVVVRWHRPSFPESTVIASVKAIQMYRREWSKSK
jgi:hypothetical protein